MPNTMSLYRTSIKEFTQGESGNAHAFALCYTHFGGLSHASRTYCLMHAGPARNGSWIRTDRIPNADEYGHWRYRYRTKTLSKPYNLWKFMEFQSGISDIKDGAPKYLGCLLQLLRGPSNERILRTMEEKSWEIEFSTLYGD